MACSRTANRAFWRACRSLSRSDRALHGRQKLGRPRIATRRPWLRKERPGHRKSGSTWRSGRRDGEGRAQRSGARDDRDAAERRAGPLSASAASRSLGVHGLNGVDYCAEVYGHPLTGSWPTLPEAEAAIEEAAQRYADTTLAAERPSAATARTAAALIHRQCRGGAVLFPRKENFHVKRWPERQA